MLAKTLAVSLSTLLFAACGTANLQNKDAQDNRTGASGDSSSSPGLSADATAKKKTVPETSAASAQTADDSTLDCSGIPLHEGHDTCDKDDEAVADGTDVKSTKGDDTTKSEDTKPVDDGTAAAKPDQPAAEPVKPADPPATPKDPNIVEFHIKAGTGTAPLNTAADAVNVKVGQTLRLINDDTITHRLHTGGAPCPHGSNFAPGATYDCVITKAIDTVAKPGATYDHISGTTALFYIKAVP